MCETYSVCADQSHGLFTLSWTELGVMQEMELVHKEIMSRGPCHGLV